MFFATLIVLSSILCPGDTNQKKNKFLKAQYPRVTSFRRPKAYIIK